VTSPATVYPVTPDSMGYPMTPPAMEYLMTPPARFVRVVRILGGFVMHRNSQKRYIIENAVYFITTNTHNRIEYFHESLLCDLLVEDLWETQRLKYFNIFAYKINPEHMHALIQPGGKDSYSEIMRSFKTNFSRNANRVMGFDANFEKLIIFRQAGSSSIVSRQARSRDLACNDIPRDPARNGISRDATDNPMRHISILNDVAYVSRIAEYRRRFIAKYNFQPPFPKFKWQGSFHDHIIRDRKDFVHHLEYIRRQWLKHKLLENKYCFINQALYAEAL
jgi:REP element-mobilizing transposase RayT